MKFFLPLMLLSNLIFAQKNISADVSINGYYMRKVINGKVGFVDINNEAHIVIPFEYEVETEEEIFGKYTDLVYVNNGSGTTIYSSIKKDTLIMNLFYENLLPVKKNGKYGFINADNKIIIPFEYQDADRFRESENGFFAIAKKNGKYGVINQNNQVVLNFEFESLYYIPNYDYYKDSHRDKKASDALDAIKDSFSYIINSEGNRISTIDEGKYGTNRYLERSAEITGNSETEDTNTTILKNEKTIIGNQAPEFSMKDASGKQVALSSFRGKYVLIDFWASWCSPCRFENPNVVAAYNKFKNKNFTVLGVSIDESKIKWLRAIKEDKLTWTNVSDLKGWKSEIVDLYGFDGIPHNVLIDPTGKIIAVYLRGKELEKKLQKVLR